MSFGSWFLCIDNYSRKKTKLIDKIEQGRREKGGLLQILLLTDKDKTEEQERRVKGKLLQILLITDKDKIEEQERTEKGRLLQIILITG